MLTNLHVQSFVLIDNIDLDLKSGLTSITGETGAGKSLIIDAISLLNGAKSSASLIKKGAEKAIVQGVFDYIPTELKDYLNEIGIDDSDELILRREINQSGKSTFRVNGMIVPLKQADEICDYLFDIHVQHDTLRLFNPKNYLSFLANDEINSSLLIYRNLLSKYNDSLKEYHEIEKNGLDNQANLDFLKYQYNELVNANLKLGEKEELEDELKVLNNFESLNESLSNIKSLLDNENTLNNLYDVSSNLKKLSQIKPEYANMVKVADDAYYSIQDIEETVANDLSHLEYDETRVNYLNERLSEISRLEKKYHTDVEGCLLLIDSLKASIDNVDNLEFVLEDKKKEVVENFNAVKEIAIKISELRFNESNKLGKEIINNLKDLLLEHVDFCFELSKPFLTDPLNNHVFTKDGIDTCDMKVSFNKGGVMNSLSKVASGGEMSRMMLALKASLFVNKQVSLVIFDEIDSGISGKVADAVARKIKDMSKKMQILTVSHLPIVAAMADQQLDVSKEVIGDSTTTHVKELTYDERVKSIAEMINPNDSTGKSELVAKMLLDENK